MCYYIIVKIVQQHYQYKLKRGVLRKTMIYSISNENYLLCLYDLATGNTQEEVSPSIVAKYMHVSKPAATIAMNDLLKKGLINKFNYGKITLTDLGLEVAQNLYKKFLAIKKLHLLIGCSNEIAVAAGRNMCHVIEDDTLDKLNKFLETQDIPVRNL